jgi:protoporphyrinogen oxidase
VTFLLRDQPSKLLCTLSDDQIFAKVKEEFLRLLPIQVDRSSHIENFIVHRWSNALPKFLDDHMSRTRDFWVHGQGDQNVYLSGDYMNAPWMEGSVHCGQIIAREIAARS